MKKIDRGEFLERYGFGDEESRSSSRGPSNPNPAGSAADIGPLSRYVGRRIVSELRRQNVSSSSVFPLLDVLEMSVDQLLPILKWLELNEYVRVQERPRTGDWRFELTERAAELIVSA